MATCIDNFTGLRQAGVVVLNPQSAEPLYKQLASELASRIADGDYAPGECIPSEPELARSFKIGRPTVRQATDLLVQRGLVERRRGAGTFVRNTEHHVNLFDWGGTTAAFEKSGLPFRTVLLQRPTACSLSGVPGGNEGRPGYCLVRLARLNDVPVLLEKMTFDAEIFPGLHRVSLKNQSISQLVQELYHRAPNCVRQSFSVGRIEKDWLESMAVKPATQVLVVQRTLDFPGALGACTSTMYCRTDQVQFTQTLPIPNPR
jgi:GntR family transcriptional regulator